MELCTVGIQIPDAQNTSSEYLSLTGAYLDGSRSVERISCGLVSPEDRQRQSDVY